MHFFQIILIVLCLEFAKCHFMSSSDREQLNLNHNLQKRTFEELHLDLNDQKKNEDTPISTSLNKNLIINLDLDPIKNISKTCLTADCVFNQCTDVKKSIKLYNCIMSVGLLKPSLFNLDSFRQERILNDTLAEIKNYITSEDSTLQSNSTNEARNKIINELSKYVQPLHAVKNKLDDLLIKFGKMDESKIDHILTTFMTTINKFSDTQSNLTTLNDNYAGLISDLTGSIREFNLKTNSILSNHNHDMDALNNLETSHFNKIIENFKNLTIMYENMNTISLRIVGVINSNDRKLENHHSKMVESFNNLKLTLTSSSSCKPCPLIPIPQDMSNNNININELSELERNNHKLVMIKLSELALDIEKTKDSGEKTNNKVLIEELTKLENKNYDILLGKLTEIEAMYEKSRNINTLQVESSYAQPNDVAICKTLVRKEDENHNVIVSKLASLSMSLENFVDYYGLQATNNNGTIVENKSLLVRSIENGMLYFYVAIVAIKAFLMLCVYNLRKCLKRIFCCRCCGNEDRQRRLGNKNYYKNVRYSKEDIQL